MLDKLKHYSDPNYDWGNHDEEVIQPFSYNGYTYATDGIIAVRVKGTLTSRLIDQPMAATLDFPNESHTDGIIIYMSDVSGYVTKCKECSYKGTKKRIPCPECDNKGYVEWDTAQHSYEAECKSCKGEGETWESRGKFNTTDCPKCGRTGWKTPSRYTPMPIGKQHVNPAFVAKLITDFGPIAFYQGKNRLAAIPFRFDGGDGILMPMDIKACDFREVKS